ncbi:hypothetical protein B0I33_103329 [Prauserella shujinwangii]|uniref:Uncharacterized protein n=1 Tax=Prauserella shujinwangii TaxID=1453103 RepID=A0A2T0LYT9_9PSEU|nr:hypothetical protein [Prauserella shujinwangii]PRX49295.1 hypothetical protein B0I33_103329 [Prauserella shujinwangii]
MEDETRRVLAALAALGDALPHTIAALRDGALPVPAQREVAARLIEAGEALDEHADHQAAASNGHTDGFGAAGAECHDED